jgi:hypothetical protein
VASYLWGSFWGKTDYPLTPFSRSFGASRTTWAIVASSACW